MGNEIEFSTSERWAIEIILQNLFAKGVLSREDLEMPNENLFDKAFSFISKNGFPIVVDHRDDILSQANYFLASKKYEYSKVFYAMYFEHTLNGLIENECQRRKIDDKTKSDIIRSVDIYGKLTWIPKLLGFKSFNATHLKTIKGLCDDRNAFVHYKWKPETDENENSADEKFHENYFKNIKAAVKYMKQYESGIFFNGKKSTIRKATK